MERKLQSPIEELFNSLTHGLGILFTLIAGPILVHFVWHKSVALIWAVVIYVFSMLLLYSFSTLYHIFKKAEIKRKMRVLDHMSIYVLIAGSYTPYIIVFMEGPERVVAMLSIWLIALGGIILKFFFTGRYNLLSTLLYLLMGYMVFFIGRPILTGISYDGLWWLIAGGVGYTVGVLFYLWHRLPFHHTIWHLFVLMGTVSHYISVFYSVDMI